MRCTRKLLPQVLAGRALGSSVHDKGTQVVSVYGRENTDGVKALVDAIINTGHKSNLIELDLSCNHLGSKCAAVLAPVLDAPSIEQLPLWGNRFGTAGLKIILDKLRTKKVRKE